MCCAVGLKPTTSPPKPQATNHLSAMHSLLKQLVSELLKFIQPKKTGNQLSVLYIREFGWFIHKNLDGLLIANSGIGGWQKISQYFLFKYLITLIISILYVNTYSEFSFILRGRSRRHTVSRYMPQLVRLSIKITPKKYTQ